MTIGNPVPSAIPGLQEWLGETGKYTLTDATWLVIDQAFAPAGELRIRTAPTQLQHWAGNNNRGSRTIRPDSAARVGC